MDFVKQKYNCRIIGEGKHRQIKKLPCIQSEKPEHKHGHVEKEHHASERIGVIHNHHRRESGYHNLEKRQARILESFI